MNRVVFALVAILFLLSVSSVAGLIRVVKADGGTITINADGSITPSSAPITTVDNITYPFTANIINESIVVQRDNIVLDGAGFMIQGDGTGNGIDLSNRNNITIENTNIENFQYGTYLENSSNNTISENNITNNYDGMYLYSSSNNSLSGNNIAANGFEGIYLGSSSNNTLSGNSVTANGEWGIELDSSSVNVLSGNTMAGNTGVVLSGGIWTGGGGLYIVSSLDNTVSENNITDNGYGIELSSSSGNTLSGNVMGGNWYSFDVEGSALSDFLQSVDTSNVVDSKPICYFVNQSDIVVNTDAYPEVGYLGLVNCVNVSVQRLNLTGNGQGILLAYTTDSKIIGNTVANNWYGIRLYSSSGNALSGNNVATNYQVGLYFVSSSNNTLSGSNITDNYLGIELDSSSDNVLSGNNVTKTFNREHSEGVFLESSSNNTLSGNNVTESNGWGIELDSSSGNTLSGNNVADNSYGILLDISSDGNVLSGNNVTANGEFGIELSSSDNNTLSSNSIKANYRTGIDLGYSSDNNTLSGNNVANNENGIELYSSSNNFIFHNNFVNNTSQVQSSGSPNVWDDGHPFGGNYWSDYNGTSDKSYVIDANNVDHYPLIVPDGTVNPKAQQQSWLFRPEVLASIVGLVGLVLVITGVIVMRRKRTKIQTLREDAHPPPPRQPTPT